LVAVGETFFDPLFATATPSRYTDLALLVVHVRVEVSPALIVDGFAVRRAFSDEPPESSLSAPLGEPNAGLSLGPVGAWP
jgi:hypothetical protein